MKEIQATGEENCQEEGKVDETTSITLDASEILVIRRALHVEKATYVLSQCGLIFHSSCTIGENVCESIIGEGLVPMWLL